MFTVETLVTANGQSVSFSLPSGHCLALTGPSGAGKSLVLRGLADLDPCAGRVLLEGRERGEMPGPAWRRQVRYLAAESAFWAPTLAEHLPARAQQMAGRLGLGAALLDGPVERLSTGQRQRGALVRALADAPSVLLLDEPTAALDEATTARVEEELRAYLERGGAIVLVTHDRAQAARLADMSLPLELP